MDNQILRLVQLLPLFVHPPAALRVLHGPGEPGVLVLARHALQPHLLTLVILLSKIGHLEPVLKLKSYF